MDPDETARSGSTVFANSATCIVEFGFLRVND